MNYNESYKEKIIIKVTKYLYIKVDILSKFLFRKLERLTMKLIKETSHRKFNETCIIYIYIYENYNRSYLKK